MRGRGGREQAGGEESGKGLGERRRRDRRGRMRGDKGGVGEVGGEGDVSGYCTFVDKLLEQHCLMQACLKLCS